MNRRTRIVLLVAPVLLAGGAALAHIRLLNPSTGARLHWSSPSNVSVVISSAGSVDIPGGLHFPAMRNAIAAWNAGIGTTAHLVEDTSPAQQARTDWQDDALHELFFDETNSSGYFPGGTGIVALTPVWFAGDGHITDADVLFNGSSFTFTTSGQAGAYDVQDVATHELGHLLGLDHSGWAGATMYPYVDPTVILHRSLSRDELLGMRDAYPAAGFASITGTVRRRSDNSIVAGAHVVARDAAGRTAAGALANRLGVFRLVGLDAGSYLVYATPLDYPVSVANLSTGNTVQIDFESTVLGTFSVATGQSISTGDQLVGPDVAISLGRNSDRYPLRCIAGRTQFLHARGVGLDAGSSLAASDPSLTLVPLSWFGNAVTFQVTVPAGAAPGHVDLTATAVGNERSILPAALEITPPDPVVSGVSPGSGDEGGGTPVTITGSGFSAGSRVVLGENVYPDGQPGGCTVVDASTIQLVTAPTASGACDAVVIDPTGIEGRESGAFVFAAMPTIATVFPPAGSAAGGTTVVIRGTEFVAGCLVRIDGVQQSQVSFGDATRITLVTDAGIAGGPYALEVANPGGATATSLFTYVLAADPAIATVVPPSGTSNGGETVSIQGANFAPGSQVRFGADPDTGLGGSVAPTVTWIDAGTLEVVTPAHALGTVSVIVRDPSTSQAAVATGAYAFIAGGGGGGGGGGCSIAPMDQPRSPLEPLAGGAWLLALAAILVWRARHGRQPSLAPAIANARDPAGSS